jgi:xylose isomerase
MGTGGFNFDAKLRRQSVDPADLYLAHISGIDTLARALLAAAYVTLQGKLASLREDRYRGWSGDLGRRIEAGQFTLGALADYATGSTLNPTSQPGHQELAESLIARHSRY